MLTDKAVVIGAMIYAMLDSIDKREPAGKRARKGILRAIKKSLAIFLKESGDQKKYLRLIRRSTTLILEARDETGVGEDLRADPGTIITTLLKRWPDTLSGLGIKVEHMESLKEAYSDSGLQFVSVKYANRMEQVVSEYLKEGKKDE